MGIQVFLAIFMQVLFGEYKFVSYIKLTFSSLNKYRRICSAYKEIQKNKLQAMRLVREKIAGVSVPFLYWLS